jgi:hypothetical protein
MRGGKTWRGDNKIKVALGEGGANLGEAGDAKGFTLGALLRLPGVIKEGGFSACMEDKFRGSEATATSTKDKCITIVIPRHGKISLRKGLKEGVVIFT